MSVVKLMTFNILRDGFHEGGDRRERIARVVRAHDPDVLCMQEGGDGTCWTDLANDLGFKHVHNISGDLQPAMFSRLAVCAKAEHSGVKFVYFQIDLGGATLGVYSVHLVHDPQKEAERVAALKRLCGFVDTKRDDLVCMAGDFNSRTRGEPGLSWGIEAVARHNECTIGPQDWVQATDYMRAGGYVDCYRRLRTAPGYSLHPLSAQLAEAVPQDWRAWQHERAGIDAPLVPPLVRIDYVYANAALSERLTACRFDDSAEAFAASDHLPLVATFTLD